MSDQLANVINRPIDRAPAIMPQEPFAKLLTLHQKHTWLTNHSNAFLELWNCCETKEQQDLIYSLVDRFIYFETSHLRASSEAIADWIRNTKNDGQRGLVIACSDDIYADGSQFALQFIKNKLSSENGWGARNFLNNYSDGLREIKSGDYVVLLDDFIGTGKTITRKFLRMSEKIRERGLKKVTLAATAFAGMEFAKKYLDDQEVKYYCPEWFQKGISDHLSGEELESAIAAMSSLEGKLKDKVRKSKLRDFSFGHGESEALFCVSDMNIPNNVFPIFWWPEYKNKPDRQTMFRRLI